MQVKFTPSARSVRIDCDKIQTGKCTVVDHSSEWGTIHIRVNDEFIQKWLDLEEQAKAHTTNPWRSRIEDGVFHVKYDTDTMFFDEQKRLVDPVITIGCEVILLVDVNSVYAMKGTSGISCRVHQGMVFAPECIL